MTTVAMESRSLINNDVADLALEQLLRDAGASHVDTAQQTDWITTGTTPQSAVDAANTVRRAIHQMYSAQDDITEALITSQDNLLALRALTQVNLSIVGLDEDMTMLLSEARDLTGSALVVLIDTDSVQSSGGRDEEIERLVALSLSFTGSTTCDGADKEPRLVSDGRAVIAPLDEQNGSRRHLAFLRTDGPAYTIGDLRFVRAVVSAAEMRFTLARLQLLAVHRATVEREHQLASVLAQAVFSIPSPEVAGVDIFSRTLPASVAGGDFFATMAVDGVLWFAVGDVAGKGLPAAMVMSRAVSAARVAFLTHSPEDAAGAMTGMSAELYDYLDDVGLFVTVVLGSYHPSTGELYLCNAGHSPVVLIQGGETSSVPASIPPLGVVEHPHGTTARHQLDQGDILVLGSDGLAEQENGEGLMVGYDQFLEWCVQNRHLSAGDFGRVIIDSVAAHANGTSPSDDRTLVVLRSIAMQ